MASPQPIRKTVAPEIPDKLYFRIGDVARLCEVPAYVLRFWETEFPQLKPNKGGTGQRLYRKRDVEMALRIKSLLYDQGYTIPGARQVFKSEAKPKEGFPAEESAAAAPVQATATLPSMQSVPAPAPADTSGPAIRRDAQLRALRDDLRSLLASLASPVGISSAAANVKPMRPRLVLEPRPERTADTRPATMETLRLVRDDRNQADLFPAG